MTVFTIIFYSFVSILLFYGFYIMLDDDFDFHKKYYGRNHCGIVCCNAKDKSHLAEYRILLRGDKVKTIGYITKDKVVFEGKEYNFQNERIGLEENERFIT